MKKNVKMDHKTRIYLSRSRAGIGTISIEEGCQRVIEPVLSPLLNKTCYDYSRCKQTEFFEDFQRLSHISLTLTIALASDPINTKSHPWRFSIC